ncbi:hypothetical protein P0F15_000521 [Vibrio metschnikovii]|uniref:hypothetical protein n=1 Tax=Vibrio metschnikovii TaxID=28172 RepID=UPI0032EE9262|nr:hypothetical protein [Vibrio metschnikovii]EKO3598853.1 hypothetical protein [Vibrio metschnikovii]EKO3650568.1 hypothetical protein [Vibrio metschnikovii]EKO3731103.1 hypothetical protein [Vibrio metschnikovii]EKO3754784.1 hypothetical protein [Vibrio metschnikovii]
MKLVFWVVFLFSGLSGLGAYAGGDRVAGIFMICSAALVCPFFTQYYINEAKKRDRGLSTKRLLSLSLLSLMIGFVFYPNEESAPIADVRNEKSLLLTTGEISDYYNIFANQNGYPSELNLPYEFNVTVGDHYNSFSYGFSERLALSGTIDKNSENVMNLYIIYQPDGTESTLSGFMLVYAGLLNALDENITREQRTSIIMDTVRSFKSKKDVTLSVENISISSASINEASYVVGIKHL